MRNPFHHWMPRDLEGSAHPEWIDLEWLSFMVRVAIGWRVKYYKWRLFGIDFHKHAGEE